MKPCAAQLNDGLKLYTNHLSKVTEVSLYSLEDSMNGRTFRDTSRELFVQSILPVPDRELWSQARPYRRRERKSLFV